MSSMIVMMHLQMRSFQHFNMPSGQQRPVGMGTGADSDWRKPATPEGKQPASSTLGSDEGKHKGKKKSMPRGKNPNGKSRTVTMIPMVEAVMTLITNDDDTGSHRSGGSSNARRGTRASAPKYRGGAPPAAPEINPAKDKKDEPQHFKKWADKALMGKIRRKNYMPLDEAALMLRDALGGKAAGVFDETPMRDYYQVIGIECSTSSARSD